MKVVIPIVFTAQVIMPRCRKVTEVLVRDRHEIEIQEIANMAVAATWEKIDRTTDRPYEFELCFADGTFWEALAHSQDSASIVSADDFAAALMIPGEGPRWNRFHHEYSGRERHSLKDYDRLPSRGELEGQVRSYVWDNRHEVIQRLERIAKGFGVYQGRIYHKTPERVLYVMTFGIGCNNGGVGLFIGSYIEAQSATNYRNIFTLDRLAEAEARANEVAAARGDTKSIPVTLNILPSKSTDVNVKMPEAFTFDPSGWDQYEAGHITLADYLSQHPEKAAGLDTLIETTIRRLADEAVRMNTDEKLEWLSAQRTSESDIISALKLS